MQDILENKIREGFGFEGTSIKFVFREKGRERRLMTESIVGIILMACSYFIGCISPATIVAKANGIDIRKEGSGNPGTTNVLRTLGKKLRL